MFFRMQQRLASSGRPTVGKSTNFLFSRPVLLAAGVAVGSVAALALFDGDKRLSLLAPEGVERAQVATLPAPRAALSPSEFRSFELKEREQLTHDTHRLRFALASDQEVLGMEVASCFVIKADVPGESEPVIRPYTPTTLDENAHGFFDIVVKRYEQGKVSRVLGDLPVGGHVDVKGPFKKLDISRNLVKHMTFVVGGSGITPAYQVLQKVMADPDDSTRITLLFANRTEADIILEDELRALAENDERLHIEFIVTKPTKPETSAGYIDKATLVKFLPPSDESSQLIFVCGPLGFYQAISGEKAPDKSQGELGGLLKELNYTKEQVFKF